ncbi:glycoside hydrolase family 18 protein [Laetiporus sulphureus 93-53]|uniref:Glycoside hydrolase family 18 protein n=1 Tax=Laetiporus sulphureus 93-53 TaxID=1314785 RepID=A0A165G7G6_9APHY|nr:glycoside hydrolase family 18 protein [Laetiporus sulphureus 93-53]KZT09934.1 glycoside hydrolase family 18 protein [Laetiporus sulphureus 93-53]
MLTSFSRLALTVVLGLGVYFSVVCGAPTQFDLVVAPPRRRSTPSAPYFVEYFDAYASGVTGAPPVADIDGYNVFILAFLLIEGAWDNAEGWTELTADERSTLLSDYADAGIALMVSCFGSSDTPTSSGYDPTTIADTFAAWVIEYGLDGIDVDYEDFDAMDAGTAEAWLVTFTTELRNQLPAGDYIITHAPVAPWFSPSIWTNGGYLEINSEVGDLIDWYNVQFYNQGTSEYTTCSGLLNESSSTWPESALFQIADNGVSLDKLVIGKPATTGDASTGYMAPATLAVCVEEAQSEGWDAGVMVWQYPDAGTSWIETVREDSWPM